MRADRGAPAGLGWARAALGDFRLFVLNSGPSLLIHSPQHPPTAAIIIIIFFKSYFLFPFPFDGGGDEGPVSLPLPIFLLLLLLLARCRARGRSVGQGDSRTDSRTDRQTDSPQHPPPPPPRPPPGIGHRQENPCARGASPPETFASLAPRVWKVPAGAFRLGVCRQPSVAVLQRGTEELSLGTPKMLTRKIKLWDINAHITCRLCNGYLIDATTVTECLHTFCRSCLVKYLEENNTCPTCRIVIHQSHPLQYIGHDRTMQDIVYKLVPGLQEAEMKKQREFYHKLGMEVPGDIKGETCSAKQHLDSHRNGETKTDENSNKETSEEKQEEDNDYHRSDEQLDILCNEEILGKDHTLKFVVVTRWRFKKAPLLLHYRPKMDLL
nr:polycomb group RING finger protein 3 isoform X2 [Anas platyrhynchos]